MAQKDIDHNYIDDSYIESKPLPSQALLKEVGSKKIKCGIYKYRDREKDVSITFTLKANHSDEQLKEYLNRVDMTKDVICNGYSKTQRHQIWLESGEYMVTGDYIRIGTKGSKEGYEDPPNELL